MEPKLMKILDQGELRLIESWGSDERIIEAARMSTGKGFLGWEPEYVYQCRPCPYKITYGKRLDAPKCPNCASPLEIIDAESHPGDERLLRYLYTNRHHTPFEMAGMVIEVKAPIMVFREWHRHRTQSYNEMSARYTPLPDENYVPSVDRCLVAVNANKQAGKVAGANDLGERQAVNWLDQLERVYADAEKVYQNGLALGVPKELARLCVPVGRYSRMRASANLRNWLSFLTLRLDEAAQWEIRQYANAVGDLIAEAFPRTWELFNAGR